MDTMLADTVGEYSMGRLVVLSVTAGLGRGVGVGVKTEIFSYPEMNIFNMFYFLYSEAWTRRHELEEVSG